MWAALPLAPLLIELTVTGDASPQSLSISAVMYAATLGSSSRWKIVLASVFVALVCFAPLYGIALTHKDVQAYTGNGNYLEEMVHHGLRKWSSWLIGLVFALQLLERFIRHVLQSEPFWNFGEGSTPDV